MKWAVQLEDGREVVAEGATEAEAMRNAEARPSFAGVTAASSSAPRPMGTPAPDRAAGIGLSGLVTGEQPTRGLGYAAKRGAAQSLMDFSALGPAAAGLASKVPGLGGLAHFADTDPEAARASGLREMGVEEPSGRHYVEAGARGLAGTVATLPLAPVRATTLPLELASGVSGALGSEAAAQAGAPWWAQMLAGMGAGMGTSVAGRAMAAPARTATRGAAARIPGRIGEAVREALPAPSPATVAAAREVVPRASPAAVTRAASELKAMVPEGFIDEATERVGQAVDDFPAGVRPTTSQALGELGGEQFESTVAALSRGDRTFSAQLAGNKLRAERAAKEALDAAIPAGGTSAPLQRAIDAWQSADSQAAAAVREGWKKVPLDEMPPVPTARLKEAAAEVTADAGQARARNLPAEVAVIEKYGDAIDMNELQSLRSSLLELRRAKSNPLAESGQRIQAGLAARLLSAVDQEIEDLASDAATSAETSAYRDALRGTALYHATFGRSHIAQAMLDPKESQQIVGAVLREGPKAGTRLRTALANDPDGLAAFHRVLIENLWKNVPPDEIGGRAALSALRKNERTYREALGAETFDALDGALRQLRTVQYGRAGTRSAALGTGTGTMDPGAALSLEGAMQLGNMRSGSAVMTVLGMMRNAARGVVMRNHVRLMERAQLDPAFAQRLLQTDTPRAAPPWRTGAGRVGARQGALAATRQE